MSSAVILRQPMDRKVKKPLMEKRRRARINQCLTELKNLLLQAYASSPHCQQRTSKLEKADILEMTVQYVRSRSSAVEIDRDDRSLSNRRAFMDGFAQCAQATVQFLPPIDQGPLLSHLSLSLTERLQQREQQTPLTLSIPKGLNANQASQPTPPFLLSNYAQATAVNSMPIGVISPSSTSISECCDSPCESTSSFSSSGGFFSSCGDRGDLLLAPIKSSPTKSQSDQIWRPW